MWDGSYFASNTSIKVQGNYFNETTGEVTSQAFVSETMMASWGFWSLPVTKALMQGTSGQNISVQIAALNATTSTNSIIIKGPTILVTNAPTYQSPPAKAPHGAALYIGIPVVFGFVALCLIGVCMWNRHHRKITLGNVMSRTRHGPLGKIGMSKRRREQKAAERVQLMEREVAASGGQVYRDEPDHHAGVPDHMDIPRRDSDALGSLVGTPAEERHMDFAHALQAPGSRDEREAPAAGETNRFRAEMKRQDQDRL